MADEPPVEYQAPAPTEEPTEPSTSELPTEETGSPDDNSGDTGTGTADEPAPPSDPVIVPVPETTKDEPTNDSPPAGTPDANRRSRQRFHRGRSRR